MCYVLWFHCKLLSAAKHCLCMHKMYVEMSNKGMQMARQMEEEEINCEIWPVLQVCLLGIIEKWSIAVLRLRRFVQPSVVHGSPYNLNETLEVSCCMYCIYEMINVRLCVYTCMCIWVCACVCVSVCVCMQVFVWACVTCVWVIYHYNELLTGSKTESLLPHLHW